MAVAEPRRAALPNRYGKPISAWAVHRMISEYTYSAKLTDVSLHNLRHTFYKNLTDAGVPIDQVVAMAGHSKFEVTKRYTASSIQDLQLAVERTSWE